MFNYWKSQPDERRYWQEKVAAVGRLTAEPGEVARNLERDLWDYFAERSEHVPALRELNPGGLRRVSLLNLAEYVLRLWGPPLKKRTTDPLKGLN